MIIWPWRGLMCGRRCKQEQLKDYTKLKSQYDKVVGKSLSQSGRLYAKTGFEAPVTRGASNSVGTVHVPPGEAR